MKDKIELFYNLYASERFLQIGRFKLAEGTFRVLVQNSRDFIVEISNSIMFDCYIGVVSQRLHYKVYEKQN